MAQLTVPDACGYNVCYKKTGIILFLVVHPDEIRKTFGVRDDVAEMQVKRRRHRDVCNDEQKENAETGSPFPPS